MGSGKTTVGLLLAQALGWPLWDGDRLLEAEDGRTAAQRAKAEGLDELHEREFALLVEALTADRPQVVAAAASVLDRRETASLLAGHDVVGLVASADTLRVRFANSLRRPALGRDPIGTPELRSRRLQRLEAVAGLVLSTDGAAAPEVAATIIAHLRP